MVLRAVYWFITTTLWVFLLFPIAWIVFSWLGIGWENALLLAVLLGGWLAAKVGQNTSYSMAPASDDDACDGDWRSHHFSKGLFFLSDE